LAEHPKDAVNLLNCSTCSNLSLEEWLKQRV